jgi:hypothetical protein
MDDLSGRKRNSSADKISAFFSWWGRRPCLSIVGMKPRNPFQWSGTPLKKNTIRVPSVFHPWLKNLCGNQRQSADKISAIFSWWGRRPCLPIFLVSLLVQLCSAPLFASTSDFNGDGKNDAVLQNTNEWRRIVFMNGSLVASATNLFQLPVEYHICGVGDFNADTKHDFVLMNTLTGDSGVLMLSGSLAVTGWQAFGKVSLEWRIAAVGDMDGDQQPDLIWQNLVTGERLVIIVNNGVMISSKSLGLLSTDWDCRGVGDFNGDGRNDVVIQNRLTGEFRVWLMNADATFQNVALGNYGAMWEAVAVGDFDGDLQEDLMFQDRSVNPNQYGFGFFNGTTQKGAVISGILGSEWQICNSGVIPRGEMDIYPVNGLDLGVVPLGLYQVGLFSLSNSVPASVYGRMSILGSPFFLAAKDRSGVFAYGTNLHLGMVGRTNEMAAVIYVAQSPGVYSNEVKFVGVSGTNTLSRWVKVNTPADVNGNEIPDVWEYQNFGTNYLGGGIYAAGNDLDGDGLSNSQEHQLGTDPKWKDYRLQINVLGSGNVIATTNGYAHGFSGMSYYRSNQVVSVEAVASNGMTFTGWSGDFIGVTNKVSFVMDRAKTISASFFVLTYPTVQVRTPIPGVNGRMAYSADLTGQGIATASGSAAGYVGASGAFDDQIVPGPTSVWLNDNLGGPGWLKYDFGAGNQKVVSRYRIYTTYTAYYPKIWDFEGSNDDANWTTLDTHTNDVSWIVGRWSDFDLTNTQAFRYYRLNASASGPSGIAVGEMELMEKLDLNQSVFAHSFSDNLTHTNGFISASSQLGDLPPPHTGYGARATVDHRITYLVNGDLADGYNHVWFSETGAPAWLKYDYGLGNSKRISKYTLISTIPDRSPKSWTLEGSNNDMDWSILDTRTNVAAWLTGVVRSFTLENSNLYRYYKLNITDNNGGSVVGIDEWEMMERSDALHFTQQDTIDLQGFASDPSLLKVTWTNLTTHTFGPALGTTNWFASSVPLGQGMNVIRIVAENSLGNTGFDTIKVQCDATYSLGVTPVENVDLGTRFIGGTNEVQYLVTQLGSGTLQAQVLLDNSLYEILGPNSFSIPGNSSTNLTLRLVPLLPGDYPLNVTIASNGGNHSRSVNAFVLYDSNFNGISDLWEFQNFGVNYVIGFNSFYGDQDGDFFANYEEYARGTDPLRKSFKLNLKTVGPGSVVGAMNNAWVYDGTSLMLQAQPQSGYQLEGWSGSLISSVNPLNLIMDGNKNFTATFVPIDLDGDGMSDLWESMHGLNPNVNDALLDKDGDGIINQEDSEPNIPSIGRTTFIIDDPKPGAILR